MQIIDGVKVRSELLEEYKKKISDNNLDISLVIIQIGNNEASNTYVKNKIKYCEKVGIKVEVNKLDEAVSEEEVINLIRELNDSDVTGIILQSPTPKHINFIKCARLIDSSKDVDGLCEENLFGLRDNNEKILPCTVKGILRLFDYYNIDLVGKNIVVVGRGNLVGRPLFDALVNRDATVTLCHSKTKDLSLYTKNADIVISAVGKSDLVTKDMVSDGFIGIDVGINFVDGKLVGDMSKDVSDKASYLTLVPGGVGPMTVAMIIDNLIELKK